MVEFKGIPEQTPLREACGFVMGIESFRISSMTLGNRKPPNCIDIEFAKHLEFWVKTQDPQLSPPIILNERCLNLLVRRLPIKAIKSLLSFKAATSTSRSRGSPTNSSASTVYTEEHDQVQKEEQKEESSAQRAHTEEQDARQTQAEEEEDKRHSKWPANTETTAMQEGQVLAESIIASALPSATLDPPVPIVTSSMYR